MTYEETKQYGAHSIINTTFYGSSRDISLMKNIRSLLVPIPILMSYGWMQTSILMI